MTALDIDVTNVVQTELKLHLTQQLHRKGYLSDEMCADATEIILKGTKKAQKKICEKPSNSCYTEQALVQ